MNAKEFAHELEKAASFIRQQQTEIDALKKELYFKNYYEELPDTPVGLLENFKPVWQEKPELTLTDEEITYLAKRFEGVWSGEVDYKGFARATLKKAQEK